eukprot:466185-Amphidinium_carterae.1
MDKTNPRKPLEDDDNTSMGLQQLLGISLHYAPDFFEKLTLQKLDGLRHKGWDEDQVLQHERVLQETKLLELYIVLPQRALEMWMTCGKVPASFMDNATDNRHGYYTFHTEVRYAISDYINLYIYNSTDKLLEHMQKDLKQNNRDTLTDNSRSKEN